MTPFLSENLEALDFGCGPGPALDGILKQQGFTVDRYDPFYFPDTSLLKKKFDFVTATEVMEHVFNPREVFCMFQDLIRPGGYLGIMTHVLEEKIDFATWWYPRDPTHVSFYSPKTLEWIAAWLGWTIEFTTERVVIFKVGK